MNTFKNGIEYNDTTFQYEVGSVKTTIPWYKPTKHILNKFIKTIPEIQYYEKYNLFLVGGVVNGKLGETWDVDIVVCGDIIPHEFEKFIHQIYDIALNKFNILVDVRWFNIPIERHNQLVEANKKEKVKTIRFGHYQKKIGNECTELSSLNKSLDLCITCKIIITNET
jgi:hypothetical protein